MGTYQFRPYQTQTDLLEREARHQGGRVSQSWKGGNQIVII